MKAQVKSIWSADVDERSWIPPEPDCFGYHIQIGIGPADEEGEEFFYAEVCTPKWLRQKYGDAVLGWSSIVVFDYHWNEVEKAARLWVSRWSATTWRELALWLTRLGSWEFDEYPPPPLLAPRLTAEVRNISSADVDVFTWAPPDPDNFAFVVQVTIGLNDEDAEAEFFLQVCTPEWLRESCGNTVIGWPDVLVFEYSLDVVDDAIRQWVSRWHAPSWNELVARVARVGAFHREDIPC